MEQGWTIVYTTNNLFEAEMVTTMLADQDIDAYIFNKQDSSYLVFGDVEVYVKPENVIRAKKLIHDFGK